MIERTDNYFQLDTEHTSYCFQVLDTGHLEHLYYGRKIRVARGQQAPACGKAYVCAGQYQLL